MSLSAFMLLLQVNGPNLRVVLIWVLVGVLSAYKLYKSPGSSS